MNYVLDAVRVYNTLKSKTKNIFRGRLSVAFFKKKHFLLFELSSHILLKLNA